MGRIFLILLALLVTVNVRAQLNFLSGDQGVSASGQVEIHQYASSNFSYTASSGSVGGNINVTDPNSDQYGNSAMMAGFRSSADLEAGQGAGQIFSSSHVQAGGSGPFDQSGGYGSGDASSLYQVSFSVFSPLAFQMAVSNFGFTPAGELDVDFNFTLSSANQGFIGGWSSQGALPSFEGSAFSGVLDPGDIYTFQDSIEIMGNVSDPFGESANAQADMSLTVVPEPAFARLLGMGIIALGAMRAWRRK